MIIHTDDFLFDAIRHTCAQCACRLLECNAVGTYNNVVNKKEFTHMLHDNLARVRKEKGLTQEALALKLNVVRQTVSKWEKGGCGTGCRYAVQNRGSAGCSGICTSVR